MLKYKQRELNCIKPIVTEGNKSKYSWDNGVHTVMASESNGVTDSDSDELAKLLLWTASEGNRKKYEKALWKYKKGCELRYKDIKKKFWQNYVEYKGKKGQLKLKSLKSDNIVTEAISILDEVQKHPARLAHAAKCFLQKQVKPSALEDKDGQLSTYAESIVQKLKEEWGLA
jgi:hypothetical protein